MRLADRVWSLLGDAAACYQDSPRAHRWLRHHLRRFEEPLRVAVAGPPQVGKSTLINAILGDRVAPVEWDGGGEPFVWYQDGSIPCATVHGSASSLRDLPVDRLDPGLRVAAPGGRAAGATEIVVDWPTRTLRHTILIDTPATDTTAPGAAGTDRTVMERVARDADVVLYLARHAPGAELTPLRVLPGTAVSRFATVNTLVVLSRGDEVGGGRVDGLLSARQLARRLRRDARMRGLCLDVVAVSGLIGEAGRTLREPHFAALAELVGAGRAELDELLLSTDRFLATADGGERDPRASVPPDVRLDLLNRLGLPGVRLATTLIRQGCGDLGALGAQLVRRSGLGELRETLSRLFVERRTLHKARSALLALEFVLRAEPRPQAEPLAIEMERILAGAHELRELRLAAALRSGRIRLPGDWETEAQRLIGMEGTDVPARLAADEQATSGQLWALGNQALERWLEHAENPLLSRSQQGAARTIVRSCQALLAELAA